MDPTIPRAGKTAEERIAAFKAKLQQKNYATNPAQNLLFGIILHAAQGLAQDRELSSLEKDLLKPLYTLIDEAEIKEYGKVFREAKHTPQANAIRHIFPTAILNISDEQPYTDNRLKEDLMGLKSEIQALPEYQEFVASGTTIQNPRELEEVIPEASPNLGDIIMLKKKDTYKDQKIPFSTEVRQATTTARGIRLRLSYFYCARKGKDSFFGPRNEIYFGVSSGADGGDMVSHKTREYGEIVTGSRRWFDANTLLFEGMVNNDMTYHMECWESDQSGSSFYNAMKSTLKDISVYCFDTARSAGGLDGYSWSNSDGRIMLLLGLAGAAAKAIESLIGLIRNDDDLVKQKDVGGTLWDIDILLTNARREGYINFDGGNSGQHHVFIRREMHPTSTGEVRINRYPKGEWSDRIRVTEGQPRSADGMSMVVFKGRLWGFFCEPSNSRIRALILSEDKTAWLDRGYISNWKSDHRPGMATFNGRLYLCHSSISDHTLLISSTADGSTWTTPQGIRGASTRCFIDIAGFNGALYVAHTDANANGITHKPVYIAKSTNGTDWTSWAEVPNVLTYEGPTLCAWGDWLMLGCLMIGGPVLKYLQTNGEWSVTFGLPEEDIGSRVCFAVLAGQLLAAFRDTTRVGHYLIYYLEPDYIARKVTMQDSYAFSEPVIAEFEGDLWMASSDSEL